MRRPALSVFCSRASLQDMPKSQADDHLVSRFAISSVTCRLNADLTGQKDKFQSPRFGEPAVSWEHGSCTAVRARRLLCSYSGGDHRPACGGLPRVQAVRSPFSSLESPNAVSRFYANNAKL